LKDRQDWRQARLILQSQDFCFRFLGKLVFS
jgi:hypothetical protein